MKRNRFKRTKTQSRSIVNNPLFKDCFTRIGMHLCGGDLVQGTQASGYAKEYVECAKCGFYMYINED